jgi:cation transport ATPase
MKKYQLENIDCASCAAKIEEGLSKMNEVNFVNVNFANSSLTIDTDDFAYPVPIFPPPVPVPLFFSSQRQNHQYR